MTSGPSADWIQVRRKLLTLAAELDATTTAAAGLIGSVPLRGTSYKGQLDPRRSTVQAAKWVSSLEYAATSLRRQAEQIEDRS